MLQANKRAVIYCRVSTPDQVMEGNSLASQEKLCSDYAIKNGYEIVQVFIERGESAKNANRTELQKMLEFCALRKNQISAVIAYKVDRIARNIDDYRQIRLLLKKHGIEIKSTSEFFEDTPAGRFMENIIANVAQFDNDVRTERSVGGMRDAVREGRFVWGAPLGYDNVKIGGKANIAPNATALFIQKAFEKAAENLAPVDEIWKQLTREGLVNKKGKPVSRAYFYLVLSNEVYAGWISGLGERVKGVFEPLVSQDLFDHVQRILRRTTRRALQYKRDNPDFPLRRFVYHPSGMKLTGCWSKGRTKKYPYYFFRIKGLEFKKDAFETAFLKYFDDFGLTEKMCAKLREGLLEHLLKGTEKMRKEHAQAQKYIADLKERQTALIKKNLDGVISNTLLREQLELIETELIRAESSSVVPFDIEFQDVDTEFDIVSEYLKKPSSIWKIAPLHCQIKLQWFNFPKGVAFDGQKFQTTEICHILKPKTNFEPLKSTWVRPMIQLSNPHGRDDWLLVAKNLSRLASIIQEIKEHERVRKKSTSSDNSVPL